MNERQLQSFVAAAEEKSFSKAARSNYISVPALIQQIEILEDSIGFELFIRSKRGVTLTPGGEIFYDTAKKILSLYHDSVNTVQKEVFSHLRIAIPEEQYPDFLLAACKEYSNQNPETNISFVTRPMTEHFQMLKNHMADCSFVGKPKSSYMADLNYETLKQDHYAFAMNPSHPLSEKNVITAEDLDGASIYCGHYPFMEKTFLQGLSHTKATLVEIKKEYDFSIKSEILFSDHLLVFPESWKSFYQRYLTVVRSDIPSDSIGIIYRKRGKKSMEKFLSFMKEYLERNKDEQS